MALWTDTLGRLPWRGPEVPVNPDGPEELQPVEAMYARVDLLDLETEEGRAAYQSILNREIAGFAKICDHKLEGLKLLIVWGEKYLCAQGFIPEEGRPELISNEYPHPTMRGAPPSMIKTPEFGTPVPIYTAEDAKAVPDLAPEDVSDTPVIPPVRLNLRERAIAEDTDNADIP